MRGCHCGLGVLVGRTAGALTGALMGRTAGALIGALVGRIAGALTGAACLSGPGSVACSAHVRSHTRARQTARSLQMLKLA